MWVLPPTIVHVQPELVEVPERIETPRLVLRPYQLDDAAALWEALEESRGHLSPWLRHWPSRTSLDDVRVELAHVRADWFTRVRLAFGLFLRADGQYLGEAVFHHIDWSLPELSLGYWVRASAARHGYMREALGALCRIGLDQLGAVRIEARIDPRNGPSRLLVESLGFVYEGTLHASARDPSGELADVDVFALLVSSHPSAGRFRSR